MKRPSLKNYPLNTLLYFVDNNEYQDRFEELKQIINCHLLDWNDYKEVYLTFKRSEGNKRKVYAYAIISYQKQDGYFIESDVLDEIIEYAGMEDLWYLSNLAVNPAVRRRCFEKVCALIDETFINDREFKRVLGRRKKNDKY